MNKEPNKVYKNNINDALTLANPLPQIPIIRNRGINTLSKKIQNINRSSDTNKPICNVSKTKKEIKKYLKLTLISSQLDSIQTGVINVVNKTK